MTNSLLLRRLRRSLCGLLAALLALPALAQVDAYQFASSTGTFTPLPATATDVPVILDDDKVSAALPIGFPFVYDGASYLRTWANSNGWVSFNPTSATVTGLPTYNNLLNATANGGIKPLAAAYWDDLDGSDPAARASYLTTGTAPNRVFTMEWLNWQRLGSTGPNLSFQVKLYETSNRVEFIYRPESTPPSGISASVGLAGDVVGGRTTFLSLSAASASPTVSSSVETTTISTVPAAGQVYAFIPPVPTACPTPRGLTGRATTATSATLSWTVAAGTGPFTVQYGPAGFNPALPSSGTNAYSTLTGVAGTSTTVTGLTGGGEYQFYVTQVCGGTAGSSTRSNAGSFILNDEPCGAGTLPINNTCTPVSGTTQGATTTTPAGYVNPGSCGFSSAPQDVWFRFTTAATGPTSTAVRISVTGNAAEVVRGFRAASCTGPFADLGCQAIGSGGTTVPNLDLTSLQPATTYYVSVSNASSFQPALGPFTICASPVPNCPAPVGLAVGTVANTTAQIGWSGGAAGSTYTVIYDVAGFDPATGGNRLPGLTTSSTTLTNLQPNTAYDVYVQQVCGGFNGSSVLAGPLSFSTPLTVPLNDDPCGATALGSAPTADSNVGATTSTQPGITLPACSPSAAPKDVWFSFTAAQTTSTLSLTGSAAGMVRVLTAPDCANGPFDLIDCASSGASNTGVPSLALTGLTVGQRYYVAVSGYGSSNATGSFTLGASNVALATRALANTEALLVYPNPNTTGQLTLRLAPAAGPRTAALLNALGQVVRRETLTGSGAEHTLSTRQLPAGVYTLRVSQTGETLTRKVVLE